MAIAALLAGTAASAAQAVNDSAIERLVRRELVEPLLGDGIGGMAVAVQIGGRTLFFNHGWADVAARRAVSSETLFNIASVRKVLEATLLAQAVLRGELSFDDPVSRYVTELAGGGAIRAVTLGELASHTSGLLLPTDHPPWPQHGYTLGAFLQTLNAWQPEPGHRPGEAHTYSHAGYILLQLALERRFAKPIGALLDERVLKPLGMDATRLPEQPRGGQRAALPDAVQGYGDDGRPIGVPGDQQTYYEFPGTGQMYSSARDLAMLLAANLGDIPVRRELASAMQLARRGVFRISPTVTQALAWEIVDAQGLTIVDKPGGTNNASAYIGLVPERKIGIAILLNRGERNPHQLTREHLLPALARLGAAGH